MRRALFRCFRWLFYRNNCILKVTKLPGIYPSFYNEVGKLRTIHFRSVESYGEVYFESRSSLYHNYQSSCEALKILKVINVRSVCKTNIFIAWRREGPFKIWLFRNKSNQLCELIKTFSMVLSALPESNWQVFSYAYAFELGMKSHLEVLTNSSGIKRGTINDSMCVLWRPFDNYGVTLKSGEIHISQGMKDLIVLQCCDHSCTFWEAIAGLRTKMFSLHTSSVNWPFTVGPFWVFRRWT